MNSITLSSDRLHRSLLYKTTGMKKKITPLSRWLILAATLLLPIAYFTPIWTIKLWAPQYPEGLQMQIWIDKLTGDINTINGLNHYIGMANIEQEMFPELKYLTYILGGIIAVGVITFIANRVLLLKIFTTLLVVFALAAMIDMYKWEYQYGHNLNPQAAIKIEGESYQPPLIGYKQLLNFLALSIPDKGGYALFLAGFISLTATIINWLRYRKLKFAGIASASIVVIGLFASCTKAPDKIDFNKDACDYCGMKLVDNRYGAMIITEKGKAYKFDDINCMLNFSAEKAQTVKAEKKMIIDFSQPGVLIDATKAFYLSNEELKSPMGGNAAAFEKQDSLNKYFDQIGGEKRSWEQIQTNE